MPTAQTETGKHTPTPWKVVTAFKAFDGSLIGYVSIQPDYEISGDELRHLRMADGTHHVCRMSHTSNGDVVFKHRDNAAFIVQCVNERAALLSLIEEMAGAIAFYANPEVYRPHPHGQAFDRRDLSATAVSTLSSYTAFKEGRNG